MLRSIANRLTYANVVATTRSDLSGRWRFTYQFGATTGLVRYRFRARFPREGGFPYATGSTRVATVTVRGP